MDIMKAINDLLDPNSEVNKQQNAIWEAAREHDRIHILPIVNDLRAQIEGAYEDLKSDEWTDKERQAIISDIAEAKSKLTKMGYKF